MSAKGETSTRSFQEWAEPRKLLRLVLDVLQARPRATAFKFKRVFRSAEATIF
jgi:hypothetical protein